jgi:hypothetical protein
VIKIDKKKVQTQRQKHHKGRLINPIETNCNRNSGEQQKLRPVVLAEQGVIYSFVKIDQWLLKHVKIEKFDRIVKFERIVNLLKFLKLLEETKTVSNLQWD